VSRLRPTAAVESRHAKFLPRKKSAIMPRASDAAIDEVERRFNG
jgi:hypothetical protein